MPSGIDGAEAAPAARARAAAHDRRRSTTAARMTPATCSATAARSARAGSRSSTSRAATSRSRTRPAASGRAQNGEIYNHDRAARGPRRAAATRCARRCDTEVLPHLYEEHGPALADHLRGMFAFAVWDRDERRGVLVRDRLGIKPLYYAHRRRRRRLRLRAQVRDRDRPGDRPDRHRGDRRLPDARLRPEPADAAQGRPQAQPGRAAGGRGRPRAGRALVALPGAGRGPDPSAAPTSGPRSSSTSSTSP